jgi:hypothetical protein
VGILPGVPARVALAAAVLLAVAAAGCGGGGEESAPTSSAPLLSADSFAQVVAAEISRDPAFDAHAAGSAVEVQRGLSSLELPLAGAYTRYRREPLRRDAIVVQTASRARDQLARGLAGRSFASVRRWLLPKLEPRFVVSKLERPAARRYVADLAVVYVADDGRGVVMVTRDDLRRWRLSLSRVDRIAQTNLVRRTQKLLCEQELCGWASGDGYDATRLTSRRLRREIASRIGPAVYAVPSENVFVALPRRLADRIRQKVLEQFTAAGDPVSPDVFRERGGRVVAIPPPR